MLQSTQEIIIGYQIFRPLAAHVAHFGRLNVPGNSRHDGGRNFILDREHRIQWAVISLGPQMASGSTIDELNGNTEMRTQFANAALNEIPDSEFAAHPLHVDRLVP